MTDLRYPIGPFTFPSDTSDEQRRQWIDEIASTPAHLRAAVAGLTDEQLDTPYRPGGWTVRQVVHHLPDSHLNSYIRVKWALTEDEPVIKTYDEKAWADLVDARTAPIDLSLALLDALHERWVLMLRSLSEDEVARVFRHPEWGRVTLAQNLAIYAWHGRHHVAHITALRERMGWT
ncbi:MAG: YfiT family bacillithiol transferase [Rhodothermales bacterium]